MFHPNAWDEGADDKNCHERQRRTPRQPSVSNASVSNASHSEDGLQGPARLKVSVMVTNGGYGAVNYALSLGVPLVVAGDSEEKPEIAARVAWAGAGINLGTGRPSASQIREAVRAVLTKPQYRQRAQALRPAFARHNAPDEIAELVEDLAAGGRAASAHGNTRRGLGSVGTPGEGASRQAVDVDTGSVRAMSRTI